MPPGKLKELVFEYLKHNRLLTLATAKDNQPWAATVFFAYDQALNLYFLSAETRKTANLLANPKVAATIDRWQPTKAKVKGIQLEGKAFKSEESEALEIFTKRFAWARRYLKDHSLFVIKPVKVIYLDDELFGPQGKRELVLEQNGI